MSEPIEHFDSIADECKAIYNDGHYSDKDVARATTDILLIVGKIKNIIQKRKEN